MLKLSQIKAVDLYLSSYHEDMTFKQICNDLEHEDYDLIAVWDGLCNVRGSDISTLLQETEEVIREAMKLA